MADLFLALIHHPVYDKHGAVVTTAVTNLDVHDFARLGRTFGARAVYVCTPVPTLRRLVTRIIRHWESGPGATYNATRSEALALVRMATDVDGAMVDVEHDTGRLPVVVATTARSGPHRLPYPDLAARLRDEQAPPQLLIFGTGWGLTEEVLERCDDVLQPIHGTGDWNHLSVRAAAAIILDRLRNGR